MRSNCDLPDLSCTEAYPSSSWADVVEKRRERERERVIEERERGGEPLTMERERDV